MLLLERVGDTAEASVMMPSWLLGDAELILALVVSSSADGVALSLCAADISEPARRAARTRG